MVHTVAVFGSTGHQGSSVVKALSASGKYKIRAITRNPHSETAKKLCAEHKDVEAVQCNLDFPDQVKVAVKGCWAVFGLTNFWEPEILANPLLEVEQGKALVDACDEGNVSYLVFSSLPDCHTESHGKWKVPHFDQKAKIQRYAATKSHFKSIFYQPACYMQNFLGFWNPNNAKQADGSMMLTLPIPASSTMDLFDVRDTGAIVAKLLEKPELYVNQEITTCSEKLTMQQIVETFSIVSGKRVSYFECTKEDFDKHVPKNIAEEFYNMLQWFNQYGLYGHRDPYVAKKVLGLHLNTFGEFLKEIWLPSLNQ
jgi:uncharacterized protein YbjT (DUF2867 family)